MFSLIKDVGIRRVLMTEAPTGLLAFLVAEFFYKFHSFSLECGAFLVTWFAFSFALSMLMKLVRPSVFAKFQSQ